VYIELEMAEEAAVKDVDMKEAEGGEEKSDKEEASGSQQQKDKNLLIFEGRKNGWVHPASVIRL